MNQVHTLSHSYLFKILSSGVQTESLHAFLILPMHSTYSATSFSLILLPSYTKKVAPNGIAPDLYSKIARFESWSGHSLSWM